MPVLHAGHPLSCRRQEVRSVSCDERSFTDDGEFFAANLDQALMLFLKQWFPREVKQKQKDSDREATQEEIEELQLDDRCVVC
jgi:tRNA C32,U32 (ribose-2'-O)-methylase TrmJ